MKDGGMGVSRDERQRFHMEAMITLNETAEMGAARSSAWLDASA